MKTVKLKHLCLSIIICALVINTITITHVHAEHKNLGIERLKTGIENYENGKYEDAIFNLEMAIIELSKNDKEQFWEAYFYLGLSYYLLGDSEETRKEFGKAIDIINNKLPDTNMHSPKIVELYKDAIEVKKLEINGHERFAIVEDLLDKAIQLYRQEEYEKAIAKWKEALAHDPSKLEAKFNIEIAQDRIEERRVKESIAGTRIQEEARKAEKEKARAEDIIGAAKTGNVKFLEKLLKSGVNPNITDKKGWFPLVYAGFGGHDEAVKLLLSDGASVNMRTHDGSTALMVAVSRGNESIVRVLRRRKAHKYIRNNEDKTALILARQKGYIGIEKLLDSSRNKVEGVFTNEECILCHSVVSIKDFVKLLERGVHGQLQRGYKYIKCTTCHESDHQKLDVSPHNNCAKCHLKKMNEYKGWELQMGVHY